MLSKAQTPKFYNSDGSLTAYSFACGYVQKKGSVNGSYVKLFQDQTTFHVVVVTQNEMRHAYESFDTLTQARKFYKSIKI